jgi:sulfite reductase alpha subunit-like flavoprotein
MESNTPFHSLNCAFSRDGPRRVYVQDLLKERGEEVWGLLCSRGLVYICGGVKMGEQVKECLQDLIVQYDRKSTGRKVGLSVEDLRRERKIVEELWSH